MIFVTQLATRTTIGETRRQAISAASTYLLYGIFSQGIHITVSPGWITSSKAALLMSLFW